MEMTFPVINVSANGAQQRSDFRALLSSAISRQACSPTARAVTLAKRNFRVNIARDDSIESRARYFAGLHSSDQLATVPHGAFFPGIVAETICSDNYDQVVYHDGLVNGKLAGLEKAMSDNLAITTGAENRGHYD